jgi:hypothetical protein
MSDYGVSPSEMKRLSNMSDGDLDALRTGHAPDGDPQADGMAQFVSDLGEAFPEPSTVALEGAHIAAMVQAARLLADKGELVARPASKAYGPDCQASGLPKPWRETMLGRMLAPKAAKVAAGAVVLTLLFSGVAVAGVLPVPVQNTVADIVQTVGIDLPGGANESDTDVSGAHEVSEPDIGRMRKAETHVDAETGQEGGHAGVVSGAPRDGSAESQGTAGRSTETPDVDGDSDDRKTVQPSEEHPSDKGSVPADGHGEAGSDDPLDEPQDGVSGDRGKAVETEGDPVETDTQD